MRAVAEGIRLGRCYGIDIPSNKVHPGFGCALVEGLEGTFADAAGCSH